MKNVIVGIGEILWDVFPEGKILGGAPANFAYHIAQFGFEGVAVSAVGNDELGKEIHESLAEKQLKHILEITGYPTGTVQVTLNHSGVPQYEICENVAWDYIPLTPETEALAKSAKAVCFGSLAQRNDYSKKTINSFLDLMPDDSYKIFDINLRQHFYSKALIHQSLLKCNILKINDDEVIAVSSLFDGTNKTETEVCETLLSVYNLDIVILTKGTEGSLVMTKTEKSYLETPKVIVADTVGAGDSFTAGFIAALLHGASIQKAHQLAVEVSAYVCTQNGAMPKFPDSLVHLLEFHG